MARKEPKQTKQALPETAQSSGVDFDAWWAITGKKLPSQHHREVVMADFKARGLSQKETMQAFDTALEQYGVKLK